MQNENQPYFRGGGWRWVLYALLAVLVIASMIMAQSGNVPEWEKCKESLFEQMFSDECTLRRGYDNSPSIPTVPTPSGNGQNI